MRIRLKYLLLVCLFLGAVAMPWGWQRYQDWQRGREAEYHTIGTAAQSGLLSSSQFVVIKDGSREYIFEKTLYQRIGGRRGSEQLSTRME